MGLAWTVGILKSFLLLDMLIMPVCLIVVACLEDVGSFPWRQYDQLDAIHL